MGIDIGTGGGRCFIFDLEGSEVASTYKEWTYIYPPDIPFAVEFDPNEMWATIEYCIHETLVKSKLSPDQIAGISTTSQREGIVLLNREGKEIYAAPNVDWRGYVEAEEIEKKYGMEIYKITGRWPVPLLAPCRLMWLKKHQAEKYKSIHKLLMLNDWVLFKLTKKAISEPSNASSSMIFDITRRRWSEEIVEWLGIPDEILSEVHESGELIGGVIKEVATSTGLKEGTPVITGGADTQCGLLGTAAVEEGQTTIVAGTTTPTQMVLNKPLVSDKAKTWTGAHATAGRWVLESNAILTGLPFRWFRDAIGDLEKAVAQVLKVDAYEMINREIEASPIGCNGVMAVFSSVFDASRTLKVRPRGAFFGINGSRPDLTGRKEFARAIIENTCYAVLGNCMQLETISKSNLKEIRICGGAARSKIWTQIQADVLGLPVRVPKVKEATSLGVAVCAGVGAGIYNNISDAVKSLVQWETVVQPNDDAHRQYDTLYEKWLKLHDTLFELTASEVLPSW
jgi:autoinducer 2 (AI-2) kinase